MRQRWFDRNRMHLVDFQQQRWNDPRWQMEYPTKPKNTTLINGSRASHWLHSCWKYFCQQWQCWSILCWRGKKTGRCFMAFADALDRAPVSLMHDENTPPNTNASSNKDTFSNTETPLLQVNPHRPTFLHLSPKICLKDLKGICRLVRQGITVYSNI